MTELKLVKGPVFDMANITVECTCPWSEMSPEMSLSWHNVTTHCYLEGHILLHYLTFSNCLVSPVVTLHHRFLPFWLTKLCLLEIKYFINYFKILGFSSNSNSHFRIIQTRNGQYFCIDIDVLHLIYVHTHSVHRDQGRNQRSDGVHNI